MADTIDDLAEVLLARLEACARSRFEKWRCGPIDRMPRNDRPRTEKAYRLQDQRGVVLRAGITRQTLRKRVSQYRREPWFSDVVTVCYSPQVTR